MISYSLAGLLEGSLAARLFLLSGALTCAACATLADNTVPPPRPVPYAEPTAETAPGPESEPSDEVIGPRFGGNGGVSARVRCPAVNGFHGQSGNFVDRVGLVCYLEERGWDSPAYGGTGGEAFQKLCPPGARAVGIYGRSGEYVDEIGLRCSNQAGEPSTTGLRGGGGGGPFEWICPREHALIGLDLMVGDYVDSVAPVCAVR